MLKLQQQKKKSEERDDTVPPAVLDAQVISVKKHRGYKHLAPKMETEEERSQIRT